MDNTKTGSPSLSSLATKSKKTGYLQFYRNKPNFEICSASLRHKAKDRIDTEVHPILLNSFGSVTFILFQEPKPYSSREKLNKLLPTTGCYESQNRHHLESIDTMIHLGVDYANIHKMNHLCPKLVIHFGHCPIFYI